MVWLKQNKQNKNRSLTLGEKKQTRFQDQLSQSYQKDWNLLSLYWVSVTRIRILNIKPTLVTPIKVIRNYRKDSSQITYSLLLSSFIALPKRQPSKNTYMLFWCQWNNRNFYLLFVFPEGKKLKGNTCRLWPLIFDFSSNVIHRLEFGHSICFFSGWMKE